MSFPTVLFSLCSPSPNAASSGGFPDSATREYAEAARRASTYLTLADVLCQAMNKPFIVRAYTKKELQHALGGMLPKLHGCHYHDVIDPAWFGILDFNVLLLETPRRSPKSQLLGKRRLSVVFAEVGRQT